MLKYSNIRKGGGKKKKKKYRETRMQVVHISFINFRYRYFFEKRNTSCIFGTYVVGNFVGRERIEKKKGIQE